MHQVARPKHGQTPQQEARDRTRYYLFAGFVGGLLLLNVTGIVKTILGIDTAAILTVLAGYKIFYNSIASLLEKEITADLAICVAVIAALIAGEYLAAAEAMFIILVGEGLETYAAGRTNAAIRRFAEQMPRKARLLRDGDEVDVDVDDLTPGDHILVRAGERITADGTVVRGLSSVDESTITGEALPRDKHPGTDVFSGTLNGNGLLEIRVARAGSETTLAHVIHLVQDARTHLAPVERLADKYARFFLPALLLAAAATFYFTRDWLRTVAVLLVGCPCALILATPTAMVAAIGGLARRGILVRGGAIIQLAAKVDAVMFDKTGTVTEGKFEIIRVVAPAIPEDEVLRLAAIAERGSDHVLARVIVEAARVKGLAIPAVNDARVLPGRGVQCSFNNRTLRAGNAAFLAEHGVSGAAPALEEADRLGATAVLVADGAAFLGAILLRDRVRQGARKAIHQLDHHLDIHRVVMLTGDRRRAAEAIARELQIPHVEAELLPEEKLDRIRSLAAQGHTVAMVGDGINDAPALAAAHVGIAVSGASDITAEAADVVYMGESLDKLPKLFEVSRRAMSITWQNIVIFAGIVNFAAVIACATGILGPLGAAFTHQISSLLVMLSSLRLLTVERQPSSRWGKFIHQLKPHHIQHRLHHLNLPHKLHHAWRRRREFVRPMVAAAVVLFLLNGAYILQPDEVGVIERFGKKVMPYEEPGLHYKLPWPVEKLTRIQARRTRALEIGYRSSDAPAATEPAAYEWNVQHRGGRFQRKPEEALVLTGDQNMIEVTATIHYRIARPDDFLFGLIDGESIVRVAGESAIHSVVTTTSLDSALTTGRRPMEERIRKEMQARLDRYQAGVEVLHVKLLDVHPSLEVVDAFRDVSGAFEEKNRLINEAEGYRNEQVAVARGNGQASLRNAEGYSVGRRNRSQGDASRFTQAEVAFRSAPGPTEIRLYLETMEQVLPGKRKLIVDANKGRRHLVLMEDGIQVAPPSIPLAMPPNRPPKEQE
ncbi:MAG TPA: FtsH protease activity modulator HflK [Bryobacteraceae bacterium]|nr:FtsH protease activity modulator HflK [Bryobacteraceae bacterium]